MKRLRQQFLLYALLSISHVTIAQSTPQNDLSINRAALRYFSAVELNQMALENPSHYSALLYYFTSSFSVKDKDCENCEVNPEAFYNYHLFNIKEHEAQRLSNEEFVFDFKDSYQIKLHSTQEIENTMGMSVQEVLHKDLRPLPIYTDSGNPDLDLANYKLAMKAWIHDFPEEYRAISARSGVLHIPYLEFMSLSVDRKNDLNSRQNTYLIID